MKKLIILVVYVLIVGSVDAQFVCGTVEPSLKSGADIPNASSYIPNANTPMKYIRVNIHFMLRESGDPAYPGNYTKFNDGRGNSNFTGYDFANTFINRANERLATNEQMNLPPGNNTQALARKYKYILNAVFFHESNPYYTYVGNANNVDLIYGQDMGKSINIYLQGSNSLGGSDGVAETNGNRSCALNGVWEKVNNDPINGIWIQAQNLNHEIGHNLNLHHTIIPRNDKKSPCNFNDYCDDTPTSAELISYGINVCECNLFETSPFCPNNLMGYSGHDAITPQQLGRIHWTIENEMSTYKSCFAPYLNISLTSFTDNISYICTTLAIPTGASITVNNNKSLYISTENFTANGVLNVAVGSTLVIKPLTTDCN